MPIDPTEKTDGSGITIGEKTTIDLRTMLMIVGGIVGLAAQFANQKMDTWSLDAKTTAAIVAANTRIDTLEATQSHETKLLCAIAKKLAVESAECP